MSEFIIGPNNNGDVSKFRHQSTIMETKKYQIHSMGCIKVNLEIQDTITITEEGRQNLLNDIKKCLDKHGDKIRMA
jgi:hypothetical protein